MKKISAAQLSIPLPPLKRAGDRVLPTKKNDVRVRLVEWDARRALTVEEEVSYAVDVATTELKVTMNEEVVVLENDEEEFFAEELT